MAQLVHVAVERDMRQATGNRDLFKHQWKLNIKHIQVHVSSHEVNMRDEGAPDLNDDAVAAAASPKLAWLQ